jgi:hypothetical protein
MVRKPSPAVFRSEDLDELLKSQNPDSKLQKWIDDMEKVLKENMYAGELVMKSRIPPHYIQRYGVNNLFRYAHPEGYRSSYTIYSEVNLGACPHILDILTHEEYDRIFGYKKR